MELRPCQWFCLVKSSVGVLCGFAAFVIFFFWFSNYEAGLWAFTTGIIAAICLHLHFLECKGVLSSWHSVETLNGIERLGFVTIPVGIAFFLWYLYDGFYHHIGLFPVETSPYIKSVWAFLTANFGTMLFITCYRFSQNMLYNML